VASNSKYAREGALSESWRGSFSLPVVQQDCSRRSAEGVPVLKMGGWTHSGTVKHVDLQLTSSWKTGLA
jgi:hypothetical protein